MYLAPLNYDRFFRKIFSDPKIARRFLEDFLEVEIKEFEMLKGRHRVTDDASVVEFDYRCKIKGTYVIIDMQQWYKRDIVQRFYLYHALNTGLQLEELPKETFFLAKDGKELKKVKDYRALDPVMTIIWMVTDSLNFDRNYVSYVMAPELAVDFIKNERLWHQPEIVKILEERNKVLQVLQNETKDLDFLPRNRLLFLFQRNIVKNKSIKKYEKWFEFAEKTRNKNNKAEEFKEYEEDEIFREMMRRLNREDLTDDDFQYIEEEKELWEEVERLETNMYQSGVKDGKREGRKEGMEEGMEKGMEKAAAKMLTFGMPIEDVAKITGLSIDNLKEVSTQST
ncbi:MAG: hypothetical protein GY757_38970 [bacterium]|nr:hypothetical protein [bacterium]